MNTFRLSRLTLGFLTLLLFVAQSSGQQEEILPPPKERPNVILVMADDQGYGDVGFHGHRQLKTPCLDAFARAGTRFERFYAAAPVCSPTRASCLTGRHPSRFNIMHANRGHLLPEEVTLAEVLRKHGYATGHFGKWHLGTMTTSARDSNRGGRREHAAHYAPPWEHGFTECFSTEAKVPTYDPMITPPAFAGDTGGKTPGTPFGTAYWTAAGQRVDDDLTGDDSELIMDRALAFMERSVQAEEPFFAVIWFHAPHLPVVASPEDASRYAAIEDQRTRHYYGCITALDRQVGRLRQRLRTLDAADDTMLWYCSDNGPEGRKGKAPGSALNLRGRKRSLYEGGIRVPAIVEWPSKLPKAQTITAPCVTSDYFPTILAAVGLEPGPHRLDGANLLPLLRGVRSQRNTAIGFAFERQAAWMEDRYKLVLKGETAELFDLHEDPEEQNDLAKDQPQLTARLRQALSSWMESCERSAAGQDYER